MKYIFLIPVLSLTQLSVNSQNTDKFAIEGNFGLNANFFVRSYSETDGPSNKTFFFKKKLVGPVAGLEMKMKTGKASNLGIAYSRSVNSREISYSGPFNTIDLAIDQFTIRHINHFFQLFYERRLHAKLPGLKYHIGIVYLRSQQQEIELGNFANYILFEERKYKNSKLEEGGFFTGMHYSKQIDTKFELGIKTRFYYLISTNSFEAVTLTPTLTYYF